MYVSLVILCSGLQALDVLRILEDQRKMTQSSSVTITEGVKISVSSQYGMVSHPDVFLSLFAGENSNSESASHYCSQKICHIRLLRHCKIVM